MAHHSPVNLFRAKTYQLETGSAPEMAGRGIVNPVGTIPSAAMMLRYPLARPKEVYDLVVCLTVKWLVIRASNAAGLVK